MTGKEHLIVGVYVDDLIVTGAQAVDIARFKEEMAACFRMSDLGVLSYYLGIEVRQGEDAIKLRQRAYALKLLERACMAGCKPHYRRAALAHTRRPDIAFTVWFVSRFMEDPREDHWVAVKRLLRYVQGSAELGIVFPKRGGVQLLVFSEVPPEAVEGAALTAFSDADMAGDIDGPRSTSGVLVFLGSSLVA
ncbi:uncharacterized protein LOC110430386 [Sorghum bicolor]|uniref:uncharacterized protein LOC110430386 n=1 Tax=Sorghum bicolor TaxID=4558 RepID=UPI000B42483F|nr:uncharacterized protein LOC110430386 [Sorghum bicolor]|eukprot:XP_021303721.1 uncharacterized protein LOC110430386 [Sorghum bicolor]